MFHIQRTSKEDLIAGILLVEETFFKVQGNREEGMKDVLSKEVDKASEKYTAHLQWAACIDDDPELAEKALSSKYSTGIVIQGWGGWHRYYVRGSGEVVFSCGHAREEARSRAEEVGFQLFK